MKTETYRHLELFITIYFLRMGIHKQNIKADEKLFSNINIADNSVKNTFIM